MPDNIIVTIQLLTLGYEFDLEIPTELTFGEFKPLLLDMLKQRSTNRHLFQNCRDLNLGFNGNSVSQYETPAQIGAFDGSRLTVDLLS